MPSPGARVPSIPAGSRRMVICVPDNVEWLSLVTGCLAQLTFGWYYNKNSGDWEAARDRAKQMYFEFQDQNGLCDMIDCDEVADCIETSENVQNAIRNWLNSNYNFNGTDNPPNVPLPESASGADRAGVYNPDCDLDITWAQSYQLVEWMNDIISNALEKIEALSNTFEVAQAISQITVLDEASIDAAVAYGNLLQSMIAENYTAQYDAAYKNALACEIFCAAQANCEISIDLIFDILNARVQAHFGTSAVFVLLDDVLSYLVGEPISGTIVVDAAFLLLWGGIKLANWILGGLSNDPEIGTKSLNLLLKLAVNDANNDWELLCEDCPDTCPLYDFTLESYSPTWVIRQNVPAEDMSTYTALVGYTPRQQVFGGSNNWQNQIHTALPFGCTSANIVYSIASGTPNQAQAYWMSADLTTIALLANLNSGTGTVSTTIDLVTGKPVWAARLLLVSGHSSATPRVVTWKECNFNA